jgi:hypothetical protein
VSWFQQEYGAGTQRSMRKPFPPDHPFTAADARALGVMEGELRATLSAGEITQILYGVYVPGSWPDTPTNRARAAALVLPHHCVVSDRSAASLHGIDVLDFVELDVPPELEVVSVGGTATRRPEVLGGKRDLLPNEIVRVAGVPVTSPARTACDIACLHGRHRAIGGLDAFREKFDLSQADLISLLPRYRGRRGVIQLRELIPLSRTGRDSQPESWIAIDIHDEGYPMPSPQAWVWVPGWGRAKIENAYLHLRIAVEYDGEEFHSEDQDVGRDGARREALCRAGWIIIVVRRDGFSGAGRDRWLADLRAAFNDRAPIAQEKRRYARGPDQRPRGRR